MSGSGVQGKPINGGQSLSWSRQAPWHVGRREPESAGERAVIRVGQPCASQGAMLCLPAMFRGEPSLSCAHIEVPLLGLSASLCFLLAARHERCGPASSSSGHVALQMGSLSAAPFAKAKGGGGVC